MTDQFPSDPPAFIGIDPSLTGTGVCVLVPVPPNTPGEHLLPYTPGEHYANTPGQHYANTPPEHYAYAVRTRRFPSPPTGDSIHERRERLDLISEEVIEFIHESAVVSRRVGLSGKTATDYVCIERPAFNSRQGKQHDRSGLWWYLVGDLDGMGYAVNEASPKARARVFTGNGNAGKQEVRLAAIEAGLPTGVSYDEADAFCLAELAARQFRALACLTDSLG